MSAGRLATVGARLRRAAPTGAVAANVSAVLAGYSDDDLHAGLYGFNGALAGLAAFSFIADNATAAAVAILAATGMAWLLAPWSRWLALTRPRLFFSSPCLIVTWLLAADDRKRAVIVDARNGARARRPRQRPARWSRANRVRWREHQPACWC